MVLLKVNNKKKLNTFGRRLNKQLILIPLDFIAFSVIASFHMSNSAVLFTILLTVDYKKPNNVNETVNAFSRDVIIETWNY